MNAIDNITKALMEMVPFLRMSSLVGAVLLIVITYFFYRWYSDNRMANRKRISEKMRIIRLEYNFKSKLLRMAKQRGASESHIQKLEDDIWEFLRTHSKTITLSGRPLSGTITSGGRPLGTIPAGWRPL